NAGQVRRVANVYGLEHVQVSSGNHEVPTATVRLTSPDGSATTDAATGTGPVDAVCQAIDRGVGCAGKLVDFNVQLVSEGLDSIGTVTIRIESDGRTFSGRGASTDVIVASAKAYLSAVNRMLAADEEANLPAVGTTPD
ncbi:MAG: alpha-isopropylmalate synthase regulatory domain-containing protein, partial [Dehalococcoidia bacterium]